MKYLIIVLLVLNSTNPILGEQDQLVLEKEYTTVYELYKEKRYDSALQKSLPLLNKAMDAGNSEIVYKCNYLIGNIYYNTKLFDKSIVYYKSGLLILKTELLDDNFEFKDDKDKLQYFDNLMKIGSAYHKLYSIAESNNQVYKDSLSHYYNQVLDSNYDNILNLKAKVYSNLAVIEIQEKNFNQAKEYLGSAIDIHKELGQSLGQAAAMSNLGSIYLMQSDYRSSKRIYNDALNLVESDTTANGVSYKGSLYANIAWSMRNLKEYGAYDFLEKSYNLKNEISNNKTKRDLERIQGEYNIDIVRKEEELKRQRLEIEKERTERNIWILGISLTLVIVLLGSLLNRYKLKQKNLQLALAKKDTESQMEILNANLKGQEAERKRISQELHDGVLSRLFGSRMGLGYLELDGDQETQEQYEKFLEELQHIEKEIRGVSHQLSSDITISETSFINAVNQLLKEKSKLGSFDFQLKMDDGFSWKELDGILEMNLFRILQESLQNIIKHAHAQNVFVQFIAEKGQINLSILDDGVGFDAQKKAKGIGLKNIASRVQKLKGTFDISSKKEEGTSLKISLPFDELKDK